MTIRHITLIIGSTFFFGQTIIAQTCDSFFYFNKKATAVFRGTSVLRDEPSDVPYQIEEVSMVNGELQSIIKLSLKNKKGKVKVILEQHFACSDSVFKVQIKNFNPSTWMLYKKQKPEAYTYMEYPRNMVVGQKFPDAKAVVNVHTNRGDNIFEFDIVLDITNRRVLGEETIITPAGSWKCFKMKYWLTVKMNQLNVGGYNAPPTFNPEYEYIEWFAPGFGIVKSETYSGNQLIGTGILQSINR